MRFEAETAATFVRTLKQKFQAAYFGLEAGLSNVIQPGYEIVIVSRPRPELFAQN
jgi:hypothetical protein